MTHALLLDVSSLGYRSYFALRDAVHAPDGTSVGAVVGYLDMVTRLIVSRRPDEVIHVYDHDWRPTVRTQLYAGYKANRPDEPADLTTQFALLRRVLDLTGMRQAQAPTWEAEDAIGALVVGASDDDLFEMVSGDRDLIQLVRDPSVRLLFTVRGVSELLEFDEATVLAKYGVPASRYAEFAILRGDPSDELPGVKGRGREDGARVGPDVRIARRAAGGRRGRHAQGRPAQREARAPCAAARGRGLPGSDAQAGADRGRLRRWRSGPEPATTSRFGRSRKSTAFAARSSASWRRSTAPPPRRLASMSPRRGARRRGYAVSVQVVLVACRATWRTDVTQDERKTAPPPARPDCPFCGSTKTQPFTHAGPGARVNMKCTHCGHLFHAKIVRS